jgi:predicted dehydrogenase
MSKKRMAVVGVGGRGLGMFAKPLMTDFTETVDLVAIMDNNPIRLQYAASKLPRPVACYTDFDKMLAETNPDGVVVATRDCKHAEYVVRTLRAGKRAFSEKPLCISAAQAREILAAVKASGQTCMTTHNMRYGAACTAVWSILRSGKLGDIKFIQFDETLDRRHGADYFRRWHRNKANSGGLQLHKASHHFDFLNWLAGSKPERLTAQGKLAFYGKNNSFRGERCTGCQHASKCEFYADLWKFEEYQKMYHEAESADGYMRDGCVWDESVDIEDQLAVQIKYQNGLEVNYSLVAYSPVETMHMVIEGTKGRMEINGTWNTTWAPSSTTMPGIDKYTGETVKLFLPNKGIEEVPLSQMEGGHGGADPQLRQDLFGRDWELPPTDRMADVHQAVQAVLIGSAVNKSLATGRPVNVQALLKRD